MPSTFSTRLRLELQATGENRTTWGVKANNDFNLLEQAIAGYESIAMSDANLTLTALNGSDDQSRNMILNFTGALTAARTITIPTVEKMYIIKNSTTGGFAINVGASGGTPVAIANGTTRIIYTNGTDTFLALTTLSVAEGGTGATTAAGARANFGLGTSATINTGTSGATIPLLNGVNTWSGKQTYSAGIVLGTSDITFTADDVFSYDEATNTYNFTADGATTSAIVESGMSRLTNATDVTLTSTNHAFQIGFSSSANLAADSNEIQARNNGAAATLSLNGSGGIVSVGPGGLGINGSGPITSIGTAATQNTGTSGATVPLLSTANTWTTDQTFSGGIEFGNATVASATDLSRHIALYSNSYGLSITGSTMNYVSAADHAWYSAGLNWMSLSEDGMLRLAGLMSISNSAPYIDLIDTTASAYDGRIAVNSNNMYFQGSPSTGTYTTRMLIELDTGSVVVPGNLTIQGSLLPDTPLAVSRGGTGATTTASARANLGLGGLSTMDLSDLYYTGSSASNTNFPINSIIAAHNNGAYVNLNASATIRIGSATDFYTYGAGAVLTGTWRCRGTTGDDRQLFQRTA